MGRSYTYARLDEVCNINYGTRVVQKKDKGSKYYVYGGGGATFMVDEYNREDCFIVSRFAMSPKCTRFVKGKFFLNDSGLSVSTKDGRLLQKFVDKALLANNDTIYSFGKGMAQRNLDMPSFRSLPIPIPTLEEQERIVAELDLLISIIDKQKQQLAELDTLAQSIFYDMFGNPVENEKGWITMPLQESCTRITDGSHYSPKEDANGKYPMLSVKDMMETGFMYDSCKYIGEADYKALVTNGCKPSINDVLVAKDGSYLKTAFVQRKEVEQVVLSSIAILKPNLNSLNPEYLAFVFRRPEVKSFVEKHYLTGTAIKRVILKGFRTLSISIPPLSLQEAFAERVLSIESQEEAINRSIEESQKLFDYTMDKYFG